MGEFGASFIGCCGTFASHTQQLLPKGTRPHVAAHGLQIFPLNQGVNGSYWEPHLAGPPDVLPGNVPGNAQALPDGERPANRGPNPNATRPTHINAPMRIIFLTLWLTVSTRLVNMRYLFICEVQKNTNDGVRGGGPRDRRADPEAMRNTGSTLVIEMRACDPTLNH